MTLRLDIAPEHLDTLRALLHEHLPGTTAWAYGSRVHGSARPNSDLDLVVFPAAAQASAVSALREACEESNLPFRVDLFVWDDIPEKFRRNIQAGYVVVAEGGKEDGNAG